ncbi:MAG: hypothetical protein OQL28_03815 [Sedimenticola sp.]|nr:hypothetical protein [Sedimenticola sp.]
MKILIAHIPSQIQRQELMNLVESSVKPTWLPFSKRNNTVTKCKLVRILDLDTGGVEYHGLVDIYPDRAAQRAIRKLNNKPLNGHRLTARRWVDRELIVAGKKRLPEGQKSCKRRKNLEITVN